LSVMAFAATAIRSVVASMVASTNGRMTRLY
jgi:hypothetical protein